MGERVQSGKTEPRQSSWLKKVGLAVGAAAAAAPISVLGAFHTAENTEILPFAGNREVTSQPNLDGKITINTGMFGAAAVEAPGRIGLDVSVGPALFDLQKNGHLDPEEALVSILSLDEEVLTAALEANRDRLMDDFRRKALAYEVALLLALAGARRLNREKVTPTTVSIGGLALFAVTGIVVITGQQSSQAHRTLDTPMGEVQISDAAVYNTIRLAIDTGHTLNERRQAENQLFIDTVEAQLPAITDEIRNNLDGSEKIVSITSDEHSSAVMLHIRRQLNQLLSPDVALSAGDISNFDSILEAYAAKLLAKGTGGAPLLVALGNHDGENMQHELERHGARTTNEPQIFEIATEHGALRILVANDPRTTEAGHSGKTERESGAIEAMRQGLLEAARGNDINALLAQNPSDVEWLLSQDDVRIGFAISGDKHLQGVSQTEKGTVWLSSGSMGGIPPQRTGANILSPLGPPSAAAYINIAALDSENGLQIFTVQVAPTGEVSLQKSAFTLPSPDNESHRQSSDIKGAAVPF